jgi:hypothetical protein
MFDFRFAERYRRPALAFGVTPKRARVDVEAEHLVVRFGLWRVKTALANVSAVEVTGPYAYWKTAGPARLAVTDRGLTFATNGDRGVCISFRSPVPGFEPFGVLRHPTLTVTVRDVDGLAAMLTSRADFSSGA